MVKKLSPTPKALLTGLSALRSRRPRSVDILLIVPDDAPLWPWEIWKETGSPSPRVKELDQMPEMPIKLLPGGSS